MIRAADFSVSRTVILELLRAQVAVSRMKPVAVVDLIDGTRNLFEDVGVVSLAIG